MSYTIQNDWLRKDVLEATAAGKVISGTHFYNDFVAIQNEFTNKAEKAGSATQSFEALTPTQGDDSNKVATTEFVQDNTPEAFPVGSVFISVVSTDPSTLLGYGTWDAFATGKMLVGLDSSDTDFDTVEETGGAKTHTLTESEMPSHDHRFDDEYRQLTKTTGLGTHTGSDTSAGEMNVQTSKDMASKGGDAAHNNMPPYIVTYMWKRTV